MKGNARAEIQALDANHGSPLPAYEAMGSPAYPTREQLEKLRAAAQLAPPEVKRFDHGRLTLRVEPQGLDVIAVR